MVCILVLCDVVGVILLVVFKMFDVDVVCVVYVVG